VIYPAGREEGEPWRRRSGNEMYENVSEIGETFRADLTKKQVKIVSSRRNFEASGSDKSYNLG